MGETHRRTPFGLGWAPPTAEAGLDGLYEVQVPLVPEIRLHLAADAIVLWARMEAETCARMPAPFWRPRG